MSVGAFGTKAFEVNLNKILTPTNIGASETLNVELQETEGGKPATYIKGFNEMNITFDIILLHPFVDVQSEIDWWFLKMRSKTPEYLTLGSKTYGTCKMLLVGVSVSKLVVGANGVQLKAVISLSFCEWTKEGKKSINNAKVTSAIKSGATVVSNVGSKLKDVENNVTDKKNTTTNTQNDVETLLFWFGDKAKIAEEKTVDFWFGQNKSSDIIDNAVKWAVGIANDKTHGYDQTNRWGPDYDCSALVITAYEKAGVPVKSKGGAGYTGNMRTAFINTGFSDVTDKITLSNGKGLQKGDVLLKSGSHTALYIGGGLIVHASINENGKTKGGKTGDQTGKEICTRKYYNKPWGCVLRYSK